MICLPLRGAQYYLLSINRGEEGSGSGSGSEFGFERFTGFSRARIGSSRSPKKSWAIKMVQHMTPIELE